MEQCNCHVCTTPHFAVIICSVNVACSACIGHLTCSHQTAQAHTTHSTRATAAPLRRNTIVLLHCRVAACVRGLMGS
eukprot:3836751-Lingulodinium_polyedra.AAC.1